MEKEIKEINTIEKYILLRVLGFSIGAILVYIFNALFLNKSPEVALQSFGAFILNTFLFIMVYIPGKFGIKKRICSLVLLLSNIASFFFLGGLKGIAVIDFVNMALYFSILYKGVERNFYFGLFFVMFISLTSIQIYYPLLIVNNAANDGVLITSLNIVFRILLSFNIAMSLRTAYSIEHKKVHKLMLEINVLNSEIVAKNETLLTIQGDLKNHNTKLETQVKERTKKLEQQNETLTTYTYINSHIFRGPVCRLLGLLNLMKMEKDPVEKVLLERYLFSEVEGIDTVVKDISKLLYENDQDLMDEIKAKAKKLYDV